MQLNRCTDILDKVISCLISEKGPFGAGEEREGREEGARIDGQNWIRKPDLPLTTFSKVNKKYHICGFMLVFEYGYYGCHSSLGGAAFLSLPFWKVLLSLPPASSLWTVLCFLSFFFQAVPPSSLLFSKS